MDVQPTADRRQTNSRLAVNGRQTDGKQAVDGWELRATQHQETTNGREAGRDSSKNQ
ncbi:hypothetical protein [Arcticibacter sp. MXS-1]|uniref:hypothetical protein n=1 Tax=Arcticibacter sp. MXS-1 TaxID=3341726 RepID=UPI0035A8BA8D